MTGKIYRILPCAKCGRQYGRTLGEQLAAVCCGQPQPAEELKSVEELKPGMVRDGDVIVTTAPPQTTKTPPPEIRS